LTSSSGLTGASITSISGTGTTRTVTVNTGTGSGTLRLNIIDNDTIEDAAGNKLGGTGVGNGTYTAGQAYTIDRTAPTVTSSVRANPSPTPLSVVNFTVTFSESVIGVDETDFNLISTGLIGSSITSISGSGATYTITVYTGTGNGTLRLDVVDNDSIVDILGYILGGTGVGNGTYTSGQVYIIDRVAPTVVSSVRVQPSPISLPTVRFTVAFSETVTGVDMADFTLTATGITGAAITGVSGSGATRTVAVSTGTGNGTLRLNVIDNDTVLDEAGHKLGGTGTGNGNFTTGQTYTIEKTAPTVVSSVRANISPTNLTSVNFTVTFSEGVGGVDAADFSVTRTGVTGTTAVTAVSGSGTTRTVTVSTGIGSGTLRLNLIDNDTILDIAGNKLGGTGAGNGSYVIGQSYIIDKTAPTVVSSMRVTPTPTNLASVSFTVTFSEKVNGVDATDFSLVTSAGVTGASITAVSGSGTTRTVTVNTGTGNGTLRLTVIDNDTIIDVAGNRLGGTGAGNGNFTTGQVYTISKP
jgi:hypothetical protein